MYTVHVRVRARRLSVNQLLFAQGGSWVDRNVQLGRDGSIQLIARAYVIHVLFPLLHAARPAPYCNLISSESNE